MERIKQFMYIQIIYYYTSLFKKYNYQRSENGKEVNEKYMYDSNYMHYLDSNINLFIDVFKEYFIKNHYNLNKIRIEFKFFDGCDPLHNLLTLNLNKSLIEKGIDLCKYDYSRVLYIVIYDDNDIIQGSSGIYLGSQFATNKIINEYIDLYDTVFTNEFNKSNKKSFNANCIHRELKDNPKLFVYQKLKTD